LLVKTEQMKLPACRPVVHLELHTHDAQEALSFYAALCGWESERVDTAAGPYVALALGSGIGGGVVECELRSGSWLPYVEVGDIREVTARAERLGARVMLAPREGPAGWRSVVTTEAGGEIAFWQPKR
jgi:uncharacterized protein